MLIAKFWFLAISDIVFIALILKSCDILMQKIIIVKIFLLYGKNGHTGSVSGTSSFRWKPESRKWGEFYQEWVDSADFIAEKLI